MRLLTLVVAFSAVLLAAPADAQPLPDSLRSAGVTQAQWDTISRQARAQARRANVSEAALIAAAEAASRNLVASGRIDADALQQTILDALRGQAEQIAELQRRLEALTGDDDAPVAALFQQARAALNEGRLDDADRLLAGVAASDLTAIRAADAEAERRRLRAGETIASRGQVAFVQADYRLAAEHYARAAEVVPQAAIERRWAYRRGQAEALFQRGERFVEPAALAEAVQVYESAVLPLAPREARPSDWAQAHVGLANIRVVQANRGDVAALAAAEQGYAAAAGAFEEVGDRAGVARAQIGLGNVYRLQGVRGSAGALVRAVGAYEAALRVRTREADPVGWARLQSALGGVSVIQGRRGVPGALERAVAAFEAALEVFTAESDPLDWAQTQTNLGAALTALGEGGGSARVLTRAVAAYEAALTVMTREAYPAGWALTQMNLGNAQIELGERGVDGAYRQAVAAYEAALTVRTRAADPSGWTLLQINLAWAHVFMGQHAEARAAALSALEGAQQINDRALVTDARNLLARVQAVGD